MFQIDTIFHMDMISQTNIPHIYGIQGENCTIMQGSLNHVEPNGSHGRSEAWTRMIRDDSKQTGGGSPTPNIPILLHNLHIIFFQDLFNPPPHIQRHALPQEATQPFIPSVRELMPADWTECGLEGWEAKPRGILPHIKRKASAGPATSMERALASCDIGVELLPGAETKASTISDVERAKNAGKKTNLDVKSEHVPNNEYGGSDTSHGKHSLPCKDSVGKNQSRFDPVSPGPIWKDVGDRQKGPAGVVSYPFPSPDAALNALKALLEHNAKSQHTRAAASVLQSKEGLVLRELLLGLKCSQCDDSENGSAKKKGRKRTGRGEGSTCGSRSTEGEIWRDSASTAAATAAAPVRLSQGMKRGVSCSAGSSAWLQEADALDFAKLSLGRQNRRGLDKSTCHRRWPNTGVTVNDTVSRQWFPLSGVHKPPRLRDRGVHRHQNHPHHNPTRDSSLKAVRRKKEVKFDDLFMSLRRPDKTTQRRSRGQERQNRAASDLIVPAVETLLSNADIWTTSKAPGLDDAPLASTTTSRMCSSSGLRVLDSMLTRIVTRNTETGRRHKGVGEIGIGGVSDRKTREPRAPAFEPGLGGADQDQGSNKCYFRGECHGIELFSRNGNGKEDSDGDRWCLPILRTQPGRRDDACGFRNRSARETEKRDAYRKEHGVSAATATKSKLR